MSLNLYKDEVRDFLLRMGSLNGDNQEKIAWLNEEFDLDREWKEGAKRKQEKYLKA